MLRKIWRSIPAVNTLLSIHAGHAVHLIVQPGLERGEKIRFSMSRRTADVPRAVLLADKKGFDVRVGALICMPDAREADGGHDERLMLVRPMR